jgi:hypothetical protein
MGVNEASEKARARLVNIEQTVSKNQEFWTANSKMSACQWFYCGLVLFVIAAQVACIVAKVSQCDLIYYVAWSIGFTAVISSVMVSRGFAFPSGEQDDFAVKDLLTKITIAIEALDAGDKTVLQYETLLYFTDYFNALEKKYTNKAIV